MHLDLHGDPASSPKCHTMRTAVREEVESIDRLRIWRRRVLSYYVCTVQYNSTVLSGHPMATRRQRLATLL